MKIWEQLKKTTRILASGLAIGSMVGVVRGAFYVFRNRYVELDLFYLALVSVLGFVLDTIVYFLPAFIVTFLVYTAIDRRTDSGEDTRSQFSRLIAVFIFLAVWLYGGYEVNKASWYPAFWSLSGILLNVLITVCLALAAFISPRALKRVNFNAIWAVGNRGILGMWLIVLLIFGGKQAIFQRMERRSTNILLITIDTLRPDHLGCYGYRRSTSPAIDELARNGTVFRQAIVQWPKTRPRFASMRTRTYGLKHRGTRTRR